MNQPTLQTDSATAAARALVLGIAVLMFAAIWQTDLTHASQQALAGTARRSRFFQQVPDGGVLTVSVPADRENSGHLHAATARHRDRAATGGRRDRAVRQDSERARRAQLSEFRQAMSSELAALPDGIAAGQYRVVDSLGNVTTLQVTDESNSKCRAQPDRDQYVLVSGDVTRYFIRIQPGLAINLPADSGKRQ